MKELAFEKLVNILNYVVKMDNEECQILKKTLTFKTFQKGDFLLKNGQPCQNIIFVNKGIIRYFYLVDGEERIGNFFFNNDFASDYKSFLTQSPALLNIDALTEVEAVLINYQDLQAIYENSKTFERLGRKITEGIYIALIQRTESLLFESAEERYISLLKKMPELHNFVPQYMIASYLNIKPETLSRIRKKMQEKGI
ncbi:CRP-like cAMP-binding protein [Arcicella aurantiaca]|uniref:CRP-like cAMP-binding protein n=1 Tax=Arcicella aurantiaca TaxID=591202 RepID=A0A316DHI2_9BACT|nr:Crp/Fnr family transcriptional regulator [Arcicella aurantiaca]PWK17604.1 CRP-like cAMP-binding protein [Arcicella aurantiaca]